MKRKFSRITVVAMTGIIFGSCNTAYSEKTHQLMLLYDTGRVTKVDKVNDLIYLDTNKKKGADVLIEGALTKDSSLTKGDFIFYGYDASNKVDTIRRIR